MKIKAIKYSILSLLLISSSLLYSQSASIKGRIIDSRSNEGIPFANVVVWQNPQTGSSSDLDGNFTFKGLDPGYISLAATAVGYEKKITSEFMVTNAREAFIEIRLDPASIELEKVVIQSSPFRKVEESPLSLRTLSVSEIEKNPGGNRDISRVIQALPGVSSSVSFRNDIIVRGGGPSENRFYLDGVEIPNLNHFATQGASGGPVGIINVDFIREVDFYSGAFPASRGNALSSVLEFRQKDANTEKMRFRGSVGATDLALSTDGPITEKTSLLFSVRRSYLQLLFDLIGLPFLPTYNDYQLKVKHKFNTKNELSLISIGALDQFRLNTGIDDPDDGQRYILNYLPVNEQWSYTIGLVYKHFRENGFDTWVLSRNMLNNTSYKYQDNDENDPDKLILDYDSQEIENKIRYERLIRSNGWKIVYGAGAEYAKYYNNTFQKRSIGNEVFTLTYDSFLELYKWQAFGQASKSFFNERLDVSLGLRTDGNNFDSEMSNIFNQLSPRLSLSYLLTERWRLNFNTGRYYQIPPYTMLGFRDTDGKLLNKENELKYIESDHLVAGLEFLPDDFSKITLEGFYKHYRDYPLSVADGISMASKGADFGTYGDEEVISASKGRAYGMEVLVRDKNFYNFNFIFSYTLVRSEFTNGDDNYIASSWDNKHIFNATILRKFKRNWEAGIKWRFVGGAPFTPADLERSSYISVWDTRGTAFPDYSLYNTLRLKSFHQLDIRIDKEYYFDKWSLIVYTDIQNVYNFKADEATSYTNLSKDGIPVTDPENPQKYVLRKVETESGTVLPSIGIIVEF